MKAKSRKVTAALLCCLLAFLSLAAELSHRHGLPSLSRATSVQDAHSKNESAKIGAPHGLVA